MRTCPHAPTDQEPEIIRSIFLFCAILVLIPGTPDITRAKTGTSLAERTLTGHIVPAYRNFASRADDFSSRMAEYCANPNNQTRPPRHAAFKSLIRAWAYIEHIRFGPVAENNLHDRIHFWPDRKAIGRRQLARAIRTKDPGVLKEALLQKKSAAMQGLGALEYILYERPQALQPEQQGGMESASPEEAKFRCRFAKTIARHLANIARSKILGPWTMKNAYRTSFLNPGPQNPVYLNEDEVNTEIAKSLLNGLQHVRDVRLAGPLGMRMGRRRKTRPAYQRSALSMMALRANIAGLRELYVQSGIADWIEKLEPGLGKSILAELDIALQQADKITGSLAHAIADPGHKSVLISIGFPLKNARELILKTLTSHTGLPLGMNAFDGD